MHAVRPDGQRVVLKAISPSVHPHEIAIGRLFSAPPHSESSWNHCIPFLEVLDDPYDADKKLIVMPLCIPFDEPYFNTVGEVLDFIKQIFEGIYYMHQNYIAHRDCNLTNIVQEPAVYPDGNFDPAEPWMDSAHEHWAHPITRTECWPRYHIIDFGLSRQYDPSHGLPCEGIILGGDKSPPEHRTNSLVCNPFPTDIYFLGNLVRGLAPPHRPLSFLLPLIDQMMRKEPDLRPTIGEVIVQFTALRERLKNPDLRLPARARAQYAREALCAPGSEADRRSEADRGPPTPHRRARGRRQPRDQLRRRRALRAHRRRVWAHGPCRRRGQGCQPRQPQDARRNRRDRLDPRRAISPSVHPHEIPIGRLFSTPPHSENSGNHCIPFLEVLDDPYDIDKKLIVMPLCIPFDMPDFNTVGEVLDFIKQIFEGIQYMHQNYIAHRDCNFTNIVQEPAVYPDGDFHPAEPWMDSAHEHLAQPITRTECWPRYHIIDFGLSRQYDPSHGLPREGIILGGDQSPPEHRAKSPICNPFPTDIYFLGNLVRGLVRPSRLPGGVSQVRALSVFLCFNREAVAGPASSAVIFPFAVNRSDDAEGPRSPADHWGGHCPVYSSAWTVNQG
ncbi:hypothetical protein B0H15DRAFT_770095 [Mycena belliarum]|uniref:Protein kinase domain-containing protein n=1 Tax=Mycena belliarum TaxID=1033014 RepID=A0AAD6UGG7_9AGAR|nr:hypothetical protein B0H15DRAFT_770095 [Mycena belliae]